MTSPVKPEKGTVNVEPWKLKDALEWIDAHGNLVDAPLPDEDIADIFRILSENALIQNKGNRKVILTSAGIRARLGGIAAITKIIGDDEQLEKPL